MKSIGSKITEKHNSVKNKKNYKILYFQVQVSKSTDNKQFIYSVNKDALPILLCFPAVLDAGNIRLNKPDIILLFVGYTTWRKSSLNNYLNKNVIEL